MRPVLYSKTAFDANYTSTFLYVYQGQQQFRNRLIIKDSETNITLYNEIQETFKLEHTISANILINGKSYTAEVIVYDANNNESEPSNKILFKTFTTPEFYIQNLSSGQIINASTYELDVVYNQPEGELLKEYQIFLYDLSHNLILSSGYLYPVTTMVYTLNALIDNQGYYLKLNGITSNGMVLNPSEIEFSVEYIRPAIYSKLFLENLSSQASVKIQSNLILIEGTSNPSPPLYIDDKKIDVTEEDSWVLFNEGFEITEEFLIQLILENVPRNKTFFTLSDVSGKNTVTIQKWFGEFKEYDEEKEYFVLNVNNGIVTYRIVSNFLPILNPEDQVELIIKRVNNLYYIHAELIDRHVLDSGNPYAVYIKDYNTMVDGDDPAATFDKNKSIIIDGGESSN